MPFTGKDSLNDLLTAIRKVHIQKPIFLKLPPDLKKSEIDDIIELAEKYKIDGLICTNLTKDRRTKEIQKDIIDKDIPEKGGISGLPVRDISTKLIGYIYGKTQGKFVIIGCGGILSAGDNI